MKFELTALFQFIIAALVVIYLPHTTWRVPLASSLPYPAAYLEVKDVNLMLKKQATVS